MKALEIYEIGKQLRATERPRPEPGPKEVVIRIAAAGICRSDLHYRNGDSPIGRLPLIPGHEAAGSAAACGGGTQHVGEGDRVAVHYQVSCGECAFCLRGMDRFCGNGRMIGKHIDGAYAEYLLVPERNCAPLPPQVSFAEGAVMMCSSATSLHALNKAGLRAGETAAVFGIGGLGASAVQLARICGAAAVYAVDKDPEKLALAESFGAVPVHAEDGDPVEAIKKLNGGGVDVSLELIGAEQTIRAAVDCLAVGGRAAVAGIFNDSVDINIYTQLMAKEARLIGVTDHTMEEIQTLIGFAADGRLDLSGIVVNSVPLDAEKVNGIFDRLETFSSPVRTVILPAAEEHR